MLVENDVVVDTRVQKEALALARAGIDVTVLGVAPGPERLDERLGPCRLLRIPIGTAAADASARRHRRRRVRALPLVPAGRRATALREAGAARRRRLADDSGEAGRLGVVRGRLERELLRVADLAVRTGDRTQRAVAKVQRAAWRLVDAAPGRSADADGWRGRLPEVHDFDAAMGPIVDELAPDVLHAHDVRTTIVAARGAVRARARGRDLPWVYDAHEYVPGLSLYGRRTARSVAAWASLEAEYIGAADRVVTVSPEIADELRRRYGLPRKPAVVLNIPAAASEEAPPTRGLRERVGLPQGVPLLVYSGKVTTARGVQTAVEALTLLPQAHLAVVSVPHTRTDAVRTLAELADRRGVADRLHLLEPVPSAQVVALLSSATVGLIPLLHFGSHEMALTNKLFEYLHAHVPVVVSDCRAQDRFVREHGVGEAFRAEDAEGLARAVGAVVGHREQYVAAITDDLLAEYSWARQEQHLRDVYRDLLGPGALAAEDALAPVPVAIEALAVKAAP
jgi:glycosyltransferase involved in cell wall biosynthesis